MSLEPAWWHRPFSVFQTNLQEIDALMDVERTLDVIEAYGADTWLLNTGGILSFYPTGLPFQTPNPLLGQRSSGDVVGDAVAAARARGIRVVSRMDFSKVSSRIAAEHPEWLFVSPEGAPQVYNTLCSTCPSGQYYKQRSLDVLDEVLDRYPVSGFFINWFHFSEVDYSRVDHGPCHCVNCEAAFCAYSGGQPLPTSSTSATYAQWRRFADETLAALAGRITEHLQAANPDVGFVLSRGVPLIRYYEANNAFGRELWCHATGEAVSAHVSARPEVPAMVNSVSFVDMPYRMAAERPERFAQYLVQGIARGGRPSTYIMGAPGRVPYANLELGGVITRFYRDHKRLYAGLRPAATVAVVRPDPVRSADAGYAESVDEFRGIYSALQESHLPFDVVPVELLEKMASDRGLGRYSLLVLPDLGGLGAGAAAAVDAFVEGGGNLLVTGGSGVTEAGEVELSSSPALMRMGPVVADRELWATYVTEGDQPGLGEYRYDAPVVPVFGGYQRFVWKPSVHKQGNLLPQAPFGPPEKCYGHTATSDPDMVQTDTSGGRVRMVPWSIGRTYRELGTAEVRDHLMQMVEPLARVTISAELPEHVELIAGRNDDGYVLHLINQSGARRRSFGPHLPISGGRLRLHNLVSVDRVDALVSGRQLKPRPDGDDLVIDLPTLELFEVLKLESPLA